MSRLRFRFCLTLSGLLEACAKDLREHAKHPHNAPIGEAIIQGLGFAAEEDESVATQPGQMLRESRLAKPKGLYQGADRHLTARREEAKNDKPLLVRDELQEACGLVCAVNDGTDFRQF